MFSCAVLGTLTCMEMHGQMVGGYDLLTVLFGTADSAQPSQGMSKFPWDIRKEISKMVRPA